MYERMFESFISLFIPFYDKVKSSIPNPRSCSGEFMIKPIVRVKSNVIEQGAEPIYLHIVPPIIKPYIKTLDAMLQLLLLVAVIIEVFVFALSNYPVQVTLQRWHKRFGTCYEPIQT